MGDTLVDLIRHGEPEGGRRYRGDGTDDPLSPLGWEQMWDAVGDGSSWDRIISSPLLRCRAFAEALAQRRGIPWAIASELREVGLGAWEGLTPAQVRRRDPQGYDAFYRNPVDCRPAGSEPLDRLIQRVSRCYEQIIREYEGRHLLLVVHAGVIRALVGWLLAASPVRWYRIRIDYAGWVRVRHDAYGPVLERLNARRLP